MVPMSDLKKGMVIKCAGGWDVVEMCVHTQVTSGFGAVFSQVNSDFYVTEWHPIFVNNKWIFPKTIAQSVPKFCDKVVNLVLRNRKNVIIAGIECSTLAHGTKGDVIQYGAKKKRGSYGTRSLVGAQASLHRRGSLLEDAVAIGGSPGQFRFRVAQRSRPGSLRIRLDLRILHRPLVHSHGPCKRIFVMTYGHRGRRGMVEDKGQKEDSCQGDQKHSHVHAIGSGGLLLVIVGGHI